MRVLTIKNLKSKENPRQALSGNCRRCHGYLVQEWESELEVTVKRCVLCGNREEPEAGEGVLELKNQNV